MTQRVDLVDLATAGSISDRVSILIYGSPGTRKSSAANTAGDSVLPIVTDVRGYRRSWGARPAAACTTWDQVVAASASAADHGVVIVDTVSRAAELLISNVGGGGQPSLKQWGTIGQTWRRWLGDLLSAADVVMIGHDTEPAKDDDMCSVALSKSFRTALVPEVDAIAWAYRPDDESFGLDFRGGAKRLGKDPASLGRVQMTGAPDQMAGILQTIRESIGARIEEVRVQTEAAAARVQAVSEADAGELTRIAVQLRDAPRSERVMMRSAVQARVKELGVQWDDEADRYTLIDDDGAAAVVAEVEADEAAAAAAAEAEELIDALAESEPAQAVLA